MVYRVEDCDQNETYGAGYASNNCADGENLLSPGCVMCESAPVSEPALCDKAESKEDDACSAHCDEERFEICGGHIGYVAFYGQG